LNFEQSKFFKLITRI